MTQNPILKVLSTLKKYNVKCLLIGGQASIIYGAAEFSRDSGFVILSTLENLKYLKNALYSGIAREYVQYRPLLAAAIAQDPQGLNSQLNEEEIGERRKDEEYWKPLRKELEILRHKKATKK